MLNELFNLVFQTIAFIIPTEKVSAMLHRSSRHSGQDIDNLKHSIAREDKC